MNDLVCQFEMTVSQSKQEIAKDTKKTDTLEEKCKELFTKLRKSLKEKEELSLDCDRKLSALQKKNHEMNSAMDLGNSELMYITMKQGGKALKGESNILTQMKQTLKRVDETIEESYDDLLTRIKSIVLHTGQPSKANESAGEGVALQLPIRAPTFMKQSGSQANQDGNGRAEHGPQESILKEQSKSTESVDVKTSKINVNQQENDQRGQPEATKQVAKDSKIATGSPEQCLKTVLEAAKVRVATESGKALARHVKEPDAKFKAAKVQVIKKKRKAKSRKRVLPLNKAAAIAKGINSRKVSPSSSVTEVGKESMHGKWFINMIKKMKITHMISIIILIIFSIVYFFGIPDQLLIAILFFVFCFCFFAFTLSGVYNFICICVIPCFQLQRHIGRVSPTSAVYGDRPQLTVPVRYPRI